MFFGRSDHSLDAKGRLILPARWRSQFERGAYLTKMLDGCLAVWSEEEFMRVTADMQEKARRGQTERNVLRSWAAGTHEVQPDRQGRIPIPPILREYGLLQGDVVVVGSINHLELWNPQRWEAKDAEGSQGLISGEDVVADMAF